MSDIYEKAISQLKNHKIFRRAAAETVHKAVENSRTVLFNKGETIFSRGSEEKLLGLIIEGSASVLKDRLVVSRLSAGEVFGTVTLFGDDEGFVNDIEADGKCTVLFIGSDIVRRMIADEPAVALGYIEYLSNRVYFLNKRIEAFTAGRAEDKLYILLTSGADDTGRCDIGSFSELAKKLDIGRATLYRSLDILEASGKIKRNGKTIYLLTQSEG